MLFVVPRYDLTPFCTHRHASLLFTEMKRNHVICTEEGLNYFTTPCIATVLSIKLVFQIFKVEKSSLKKRYTF